MCFVMYTWMHSFERICEEKSILKKIEKNEREYVWFYKKIRKMNLLQLKCIKIYHLYVWALSFEK